MSTAPQARPAAKPWNTDAVKAFLIVMIVLGHNRILTDKIDGLFNTLYFWHVQGFFLLALQSRGVRFAEYRPLDMLTRYYVPFLWHVVPLTILGLVAGLNESIAVALGAVFVGSAYYCELAFGMSIFWFLPAMAGFAVVTIWFARLLRRGTLGMAAVGAIAAASLLCLPFIPAGILNRVPLGIGPVMYVLPVALAFMGLLKIYERGALSGRAIVLGLCAVITALQVMAIASGTSVNISTMTFVAPFTWPTYVFSIAACVATNLLVWAATARLRPNRVIGALAKHSMRIFLYHQFVQFGLYFALRSMVAGLTPALGIVIGLAVSIVSLAICIGLSLGLSLLPRIEQLVFPKDWPTLRSTVASLLGSMTGKRAERHRSGT